MQKSYFYFKIKREKKRRYQSQIWCKVVNISFMKTGKKRTFFLNSKKFIDLFESMNCITVVKCICGTCSVSVNGKREKNITCILIN